MRSFASKQLLSPSMEVPASAVYELQRIWRPEEARLRDEAHGLGEADLMHSRTRSGMNEGHRKTGYT